MDGDRQCNVPPHPDGYLYDGEDQELTVQELTAVEAQSATPPSYFTSGVSGVVIDTVVAGAATAHLLGVGTVTTITGADGSAEGHTVGPAQDVDLVRGDTLVYPIGALEELASAFESRNLTIVRVVLHDVTELIAGRIDDTVTLRTIGVGTFPADGVVGRTTPLIVSVDWVEGLTKADVPSAPCREGDVLLLATALGPVEYDDGTRQSGLLVSIVLVVPPGH